MAELCIGSMSSIVFDSSSEIYRDAVAIIFSAVVFDMFILSNT